MLNACRTLQRQRVESCCRAQSLNDMTNPFRTRSWRFKYAFWAELSSYFCCRASARSFCFARHLLAAVLFFARRHASLDVSTGSGPRSRFSGLAPFLSDFGAEVPWPDKGEALSTGHRKSRSSIVRPSIGEAQCMFGPKPELLLLISEFCDKFCGDRSDLPVEKKVSASGDQSLPMLVGSMASTCCLALFVCVAESKSPVTTGKASW